jgi:signal transduction histidine kinase/DNA-binding response OmpR family regulator
MCAIRQQRKNLLVNKTQLPDRINSGLMLLQSEACMWKKFRDNTRKQENRIDLTADILESATKNTILVVSIITGSWAVLITLLHSGDVPMILALVAVLYVLSITWLLKHIGDSPFATQLLWFATYTALIILGLSTLQIAEFAYLLILVPIMAVMLSGWAAASVSGTLLLITLLILQRNFEFTFLSDQVIWMFLFGEILFTAAAWAITGPLIESAEWAADRYAQAWQDLEEARQQRVEFKQVQEDLLLANTELRRLSNQLRIMTERAEEARQIKEEFVANVSHELRTPLNMIIGYANLIVNSPRAYGKNLPSRLLVDISAIQRNSELLVDLINDVLDLSQVETGRMALTRNWVSLHKVIEAATAAIHPLFLSKGLYLETKLPDEDIPVYCDSTRIREVVLNLLSNAGRFTEEGGVIIDVLNDDQQVTITVQDTGPGIPTADLERVFEPFQQLDPILHHRTGGSGLGLTISKRFVEMHSGRMWVESEPGKGAKFSFSIPSRALSSEIVQKPTVSQWINPYKEYIPRGRPFKGPNAELTPRFLVVEKEKTLHRLFSRYLDGIEFLSVETLEEALLEHQQSPAQVVIINDLMLQNDRLEEVSFPYDIPIVTCWIPGREEAASRLGVVAYLLKPVQQEDLLAAIDQLGKPEMTLLLVDDDKDTLRLLARIISVTRPSHHVIRTSSGYEALQVMRERQPDAVLLDLILPDLNGYQILKLKEEDPKISTIPVLVITSTDPTGVPIVSNQLGVQRANGLSIREFLDCIMALHTSLNGVPRRSDPEPSERLPA